MKMCKCGWKTECGGCSCRLYTREEGKFGMLVWTLKNGYIKSPMCWITSVFKTTALPSESNTQSLSKHTRSFTGTARLYVTSMFEPCVLHTFSCNVPRVHIYSPSRLSSTQGPVDSYIVPSWLCTWGAAPSNQQCDNNRNVQQ